MLEGRRALDLALNLAQMPTLAHAMREQPVPLDTLVVIRIAAGCAETVDDAAEATGASLETIREAAVLYLQMVLLPPGSDSHRILGVRPDANRAQMREHMRWLLRWLHPDRNPNEWESVFAERVIGAWRDAGTTSAETQRKNSQEAENPRRRLSRTVRRGKPPVNRWIAVPIKSSLPKRHRLRGRMIAIVAAAIAALAILAINPISKWVAGATATEEVEKTD